MSLLLLLSTPVSSALITASDSATGTEAISVQHDLSALFPVGTGSGQRNFGKDKRKAIEQPAQPRYSDVVPPLVFPVPRETTQASGAQDVAQAVETASVAVSAAWADNAIAADSVALAIAAGTIEQAHAVSKASIEVGAAVADQASGSDAMGVVKRLSAHVVQTQQLYIMGFFD